MVKVRQLATLPSVTCIQETAKVLYNTVIIIKPSFIKENTMKFEVEISNTHD